MSQAGLLKFSSGNLPPDVPTTFVANVGSATPVAHVLNILGTYVAAGSIPVETTASGNTLTVDVQISQGIAASDISKIGLSAFDSSAFSVDANGFVKLVGGGVSMTNIDVDAHTAPGTDPVVPSGGNIIMTGAQVASGTIGTNVIRTDSLAANTVTIEIQRSASVAAGDMTKNGVSHFNSSQFSVDASGFVTLAGGGIAIDSIGTQTGTNPIAPTAAGLVTINGAVVAAGTNPVRSDGTGANTMALEVQISQAIAATDATKIGLCNFDSSKFTVDANGFVSTSGTGIAQTITGDSGGALSPTAGNWNILGSGSITTSGAASTLTVQLTGLTNHALLIGAGTTTITKLGAGSTGQILQTNTTADPTWSTATYPSTATGIGTILRADGTNWVATTATYPATTTINRVLFSSANNVISEISTAIDGVMITSHTGVPSVLANSGTAGWVLTANSGAPPSWQAAGGGASLSDYTDVLLLGGM